ncbi:E3 ubiquitin-protein ligase DTX3L [Sardina pilchardus]|uniref:E3 ubiquitin-protein ligase DTX3L n=1 Tax=Sardina pilchardus TaxID=27697 RepID=UPI002E0F80E6
MANMPEVLLTVTIPGETSGSYAEAEIKAYELMAQRKSTGAKYDKQKANYHSMDQLYNNDCAPAGPVKVDSTVMTYINEIYHQELKRIIGENVQMTQSKGGTIVSFNSKQTVLAQFTRQKFITFYQKIATEFQTKRFDYKPSQVKLLEAEFPDLLITPDTNKSYIMVTGGYKSIERLEQHFNGVKSPSRSLGHTTQQASAKDIVSPATQQSKKVEEETCPICMDTLTEKKTLPKCKHSFCKDCLKRAFDFKPVCPICGVLYGQLKGTQPEKGTMRYHIEDKTHLPGYERNGTIVIDYYIPNGTQGEEHPSPGQPYEGASRTAYLPHSSEGRKVLGLLQRAFDQRLIFTIGRSSTSGRNNVVTWNDIHHKTSRTGGPSSYGYPDPEYLSRVQEELKVKGIY